MNIQESIIKEIIKKKATSLKEVYKIRDKLCREHHPKDIPSIKDILIHAKPSQLKKLKFLKTKPIRTISGVAPLAVMTKPLPCPHGKCTTCPGGPESFFGNVPQSYTGHEPATRRGIRNLFDPYLQVFNRLEHYILLNHNIDKAELIVMGGTFPSYPKEYQDEFITYSLKAMNDFGKLFFRGNKIKFKKFKKFFELPHDMNNEETIRRIQKKILKYKKKSNLEKEKKRNEKAKVRCVAMCLETRPDYGKLKQGNQILQLGGTRVELGIQSIYNNVLKKINRGHTTKDSIESIRILKDLGFKVAAHYMIGLPGSNLKKDLEGLKKLFSDSNYKPDMLKIYPCIVIKGTKLYTQWKKGKYKPLTIKKAAELIVEFKKFIPPYCRIQRIQRDIAEKIIEAGVNMTNLRQFIHQNYKINCQCIRCREPKNKKINFEKVKIQALKYEASKGKEFFISAEDIENNLLIGFCRMRFPSKNLRKEITKNSALIRELHVYGILTKLKQQGNIQHKGFGKRLLKKAEEIAKKEKKKKIIIISGIGVRSYYQKLGYKKEGPYMIKKI